ncbi:hypothetical protein L9F63_025344 [Diploptera punctata]|uniref:Ionotropic glutamate receptor C-terminal domain-containing protein n=1 Tax=Diploptera punctata TaxID=6984 RepID=A0AAD8E4B1_DIPPU|nr:hypothetical protein L9F63_025344 [Diploptera punctata]
MIVFLPVAKQARKNKPAFRSTDYTCLLKPQTYSDVYHFAYSRCAVDIMISKRISDKEFNWMLNPPIRTTYFGELQDELMMKMHSLQLATVVVIGDINILSLPYHHFDGFIIFLFGKELSSELNGGRDLLSNVLIQELKIVFIILGIADDLKPITQFVNTYSLYQSVVILEDVMYQEINIFTWNHGDCGKISNITLLDSCRNNKSLDKSKFESINRPTNFENCTLNILTISQPPFMKNRDDGTKEGSDILLIKIITSHLGFNFVLNSQHRSLRQELHFGNLYDKIDAIVFLRIYYTESFSWFIPRAASHPRISSPTRVFSSFVWGCVFIVFVLVSICLKYLGLFGFRDRTNFSFFIICFGLFLNVAAPRIPSGTKLRIILFSWVTFSIAFNTVFQAYMTSFFTDPGRQHQIDNLDELEESDLKLFFDPYRITYWHLMINNITDYYFSINISHTIKSVVYGSRIGLLLSDEVFIYNLPEVPRDFNWKLVFHKFSKSTINIHRTLQLHITSPFVPLVNSVVEKLVEGGIVDKVVRSNVDPTGKKLGDVSEESLINIFEPLSLFHIFSSCMYLFIGLFLSFVFFVAEILLHKLSSN